MVYGFTLKIFQYDTKIQTEVTEFDMRLWGGGSGINWQLTQPVISNSETIQASLLAKFHCEIIDI